MRLAATSDPDSLRAMSSPDWLVRLCVAEGVPSALVAARDAVDVLLRDRGLRRSTPQLTAESLLCGAVASAVLDGATCELEALRVGNASPTALGVARMTAESLGLVPTLRTAPLQVIARLHTLAAAGVVPGNELGRVRAAPGVAARLQVLARILTSCTDLPAIAVAGIAHAEVVAARPFTSLNGVVARALERLVLVARGVDPASVLVPEEGHRLLEADYRALLAAYEDDREHGGPAWLLHTARAVAGAVAASPLSRTA